MRWLKWVIIGVLGLIVVLVVTVYIVLSRYNFNDLKPQITQAAKDATGRELKLGGDIQLKIGMTPALAVDNVSFQNAPWGSRPELAKIKRFEVQVELIPLLSGNIGIKRLILIEPDILIESDKTGKSNLAFETAKKPEAAPKEAPAKGPTKLPALTFDQVKLEKARLTYRDGVTGKSTVVALENLVADAPSMSGPVKLSLKGAYNDKPFEVSGTLGSILGAMDATKPWPLKMEAKAGGATVTVEGQITDLQNLKALSVVLNAQGASIPELAKLGDVKDVPDVGPFKAMIKVTGSGDKPSVEALDVDLGTEDLAKVKLTGAFKDPMGKKGLDLVFAVKGKEMGNLQKLTGQASPLKGPFEISARAADAGEKAFKISDMKVSLPNMDLAGTAEVNLAGARPRLAANLSSQKMDLRPFMPEEKKGEAAAKTAKPAAKKDKVFPSDPLQLEGLKAADATVQVRAKQIITPQVALDDLTLDLSLKDGALNVKPLKAFVGGGSLDVSVALQPQGKDANLAVAVKMDKIDIGRMAKEMQVTDVLEGKIDGEVDLKGRGGSVAAIMAGLNGKTVLVMGKGRLDNKYIDLVGADLAAGLFRLVNPFEKEKGKYTEINCLVSRFDIKDGMAQNTALVFDTSRMSVIGDGNINLKTEGLDLSLKPSPKEGAGVPGVGKVGVNLSEVVKPFKLAGTMANPSLGIDPAQAAMTIGKSLGGAALGGPVGIAGALAGGGSSGDENPCAKALDAAKSGVKPAEKSPTEKAKEGVTGGAKGAAEGGLKKLFKK
jgi:AsmA family protein